MGIFIIPAFFARLKTIFFITFLIFSTSFTPVSPAVTESAETRATTEFASANPAAKLETVAVETKNTQKSTPVKTGAVTKTASVKTASAPVYRDTISITGNTVEIFKSSDTKIDAGNRVALFGKLLYAHNYASIFGKIGSAKSFSVTLDGVTKNYQVVKVVTLTKAETANFMRAFKYGQYLGQSYDYVLMTCAGTIYGNGDASHRMIVFANAV